MYLYITQNSGESILKLQDLLLERLDKDSQPIKLKTLRVIKHLLQKGHPSFKRELASQAGKIRPCLNYRGPIDPLHGDVPNQLVRTEAQDVLNMLFSADHTSYSSPSSSDDYTKKSIQSSHMRSENFGTMSSITKAADSAIAGAQDIRNKISAKIFANAGPNRNTDLSNFGGFGSPGSFTSPTFATPNSVPHTAGRPGGDWGAHNSNSNGNHTNQPTSGDDEESIVVDEFTAATGISSPSFTATAQFSSKCASLDPYRISELLYDKLAGSRAWQTKQKAVIAIEALLQSKASTPYLEFFSNNYEAIVPLLAAVHAVTREKTKKVLSVLADVNPDITQHLSNNAPSSTASPQPVRSTQADTPAPQPAIVSSLFEGLSVEDNSAPSPPLTSASPAPTRSQQTRTPLHTAAAAPAPAPPPAQPVVPLVSLLDDSEVPSIPQSSQPTIENSTPKSAFFDVFDPLAPSAQSTPTPVSTTTPANNQTQPSVQDSGSFEDMLAMSANPQPPRTAPNTIFTQPYPYPGHYYQQPQTQHSLFLKNPTPTYTPPLNGYVPMRPNIMMASNVPVGPASQNHPNSQPSDSFNFVNNTSKKDAFGDLVTQQISSISK